MVRGETIVCGSLPGKNIILKPGAAHFLAMKMIEAGFCVVGCSGSFSSTSGKPLSANKANQVSIFLKYHGAGSEKSSLNPAHDPSLHPST